MALAVNITDGREISNKVHHELLLRVEEQDGALCAVHFTVKVI